MAKKTKRTPLEDRIYKNHIEGRNHRYLFAKAELIRKAGAEVALDPTSREKAAYLRGLCDGQHGTTHKDTAEAIHMGRQIINAHRATVGGNVVE